MWAQGKDGAIFTVCSHTFTLFWSIKASVVTKIFQSSFHVCDFRPEISSFFSKSVPILFYFSCMGVCFASSSSFSISTLLYPLIGFLECFLLHVFLILHTVVSSWVCLSSFYQGDFILMPTVVISLLHTWLYHTSCLSLISSIVAYYIVLPFVAKLIFNPFHPRSFICSSLKIHFCC